jgi:transcriptional regulator with XRE-family HTH domain
VLFQVKKSEERMNRNWDVMRDVLIAVNNGTMGELAHVSEKGASHSVDLLVSAGYLKRVATEEKSAPGELWQRLRHARSVNHVSQQQIADACGLTRVSVTKWESKDPTQRSEPRLDHLRIFAELTGFSFEWLAGSRQSVSSGGLALTWAGYELLSKIHNHIAWERIGDAVLASGVDTSIDLIDIVTARAIKRCV